MVHVGNCKLIISRNNGTLFREIGTNFLPKEGNMPSHFGDFKQKINEIGQIPKSAYPSPDIQILQVDKNLDF